VSNATGRIGRKGRTVPKGKQNQNSVAMKAKHILGVIGFFMLFAIPSEEALVENLGRAMGVWALWFCGAMALLYFAGAFKSSTSKTSR
jgi:hypothetical protein